MRPRVLIIDDEETILTAMDEYLTIHGFSVSLAQDAERARALLRERRFSVVILDLRLAGRVSGLEIAREIRRSWPGIRVVVLTAYGTSDAQRQAYEIGVDSFLHKPMPLMEIVQTVRAVLRGGALRDG